MILRCLLSTVLDLNTANKKDNNNNNNKLYRYYDRQYALQCTTLAGPNQSGFFGFSDKLLKMLKICRNCEIINWQKIKFIYEFVDIRKLFNTSHADLENRNIILGQHGFVEIWKQLQHVNCMLVELIITNGFVGEFLICVQSNRTAGRIF